MSFAFTVHQVDPASAARRSTFSTPHGPVPMPAFMPVGTQGTVKGVMLQSLRDTGAAMILGNTYHLHLRPGEELVRGLGGLHQFCGWTGPILTDSGGFQIFSLSDIAKITEHGATFRSHLDGSKRELTPEKAVAIQEALGSDVAMQLDHVVALPAEPERVRDACQRSVRWARRCKDAAQRSDQAQFAIVQGGLDPALRQWSAEQLIPMDFPGYAIGGLSVGETPAEMVAMLDVVCPVLPADKPRYLMGVGRPEDLLEGVRRGVDMFDCVMPTRNGRNAMAFTSRGNIKIRNLKHARDESPLDDQCPCPACTQHSRAYLRHLFQAEEMLGPMLLSLHNLTYYQTLMSGIRTAIEAGRFMEFYRERMTAWGHVSQVGASEL